MGFMRKALFLGTGGLSGAAGIRLNSKKERTAKALETQVRLQKRAMRRQPSVARSPTAVATPPVAPKRLRHGDCSVTLVAAGDQILPVVRAVHEVVGLDWKEARRFIDHVPCSLDAISRADAEVLTAALESAGATVELRVSESPLGAVAPRAPLQQHADIAIQLRKLLELRVRESPSGAGAPSASTGQPADLADQLGRLGELHATGVLTDDEFTAAKARVLAG